MNYEHQKKRDEYELDLARQIEKFAKRINKGYATSEELVFMSKVADMLDGTRKKEIFEKSWDASLAVSKIRDAV